MTPEQFVAWLTGYAEAKEFATPSPSDWSTIQHNLMRVGVGLKSGGCGCGGKAHG